MTSPDPNDDSWAVATEHTHLVPADDSLDAAEAGFAEAARAPSTLRGYRSDWAEFTGWCHLHGHTPMPVVQGRARL